MSEHIKVSQSGAVLEVIFARPDKKNALTNAMYRAAREALESAQADPAVRVVLFGSDSDIFCAGNDLADFAAAASGQGGALEALPFIEALALFDKPIVAAVPGLAVGIGTTMLLHCDLVYLADTARLIAPFINLGLVPEAASSLLLPAHIGHVRAFAMFALGEPLSAHEALAFGLANKVLPAAEVLPAARADAAVLAAKPPGALVGTKRLMRDGEALLAHTRTESAVVRKCLQSAEAREAFSAFLERRAPDFSRVSG